MAELFQGITVFGLYDDVTGNALEGVIGQPVPLSAVYVGGKDTASGDLVPLSFTGGNLNVNATVTPPSDTIQTGSLTSAAGTVTISTQGTSALMLQIEGTWVGTLSFQCTKDGGNSWEAIQLYPLPIPGGAEGSPSVSSTTANGQWTLPIGGIQQIRVNNGAGLTSGTANIYLTAGQGQYSVFTYSDNAANFLATVYQGTSPWVTTVSGSVSTNVTEWNTVALGSPTAWGTAPTGNVIGVNAELFAGTTALTATGTSLNVDVTGGTVAISGTVAVTQSTSPWIVAGGGTAGAPGTAVLTIQGITGGTAVTVAGSKTNNNAAPNGSNLGVLPAQALATPTAAYTAGNAVLLVTDLAGNLNTDLQYYAGSALGTPSVFGTSPGAVTAQQANASIFSGTTAITNTGGSLNVNITGTTGGTLSVAGTLTNNNAAPAANNVGTLGYVATATPETYTQGDQVLATTSLGGAVRTVPVDEANASSLSYYEIDNANAYVSVTTAFTPIMAWQTNSASFIYLIRMLQFFTSGTVCEFVLLKNPTVTGGAFVAASGHLSYNVTATSYTGGTKVLGGYAGTQPFLMQQMLDAMAAGAPGDTFAIQARSFTGTGNVVSAVRWSEQSAAL